MSKHPQWLKLYFALASLYLVTIIASLALSHQIDRTFTESIQANRIWENRATSVTNLEEVAGELDAPGNNIFDSHDVAYERKMLATSHRKFLEVLATLRQEGRQEADPTYLRNFDLIEKAMEDMTREAELIFADFDRHDLHRAGERMALMDYKYGLLLNSIRNAQRYMRDLQTKAFQRQGEIATQLQTMEYGLAAFVLLLIYGMTRYGRVLSNNYTTEQTEREKLFRELQTRSAELQSSLKEIEDMKYSLDESSIVATTDIRGTITYVNEQFCKISGYSKEELIGQNHRILNSGHHPEEFFKTMWKTIASGEVWQGEVKNQAKDGHYYWVDSTIVPLLNEKNIPERYIAIRHDITKRKQMEAELVDSKTEADKANAAKSEFLANMSHEIRTPMNGIMGMCQLLLETDLSLEQCEYTKTIDHSAESLLVIINDILDFSKIEAGKLDIENIPFQLRQCLDEMVELLLPKIHNKDFEFMVRVDPKIPDDLIGDPGRIRQILLNLLTNAFKFTDSGHVIADIQCSKQTGDEILLYVEVNDTGKGIAAEKLPILFDKFTQEDSSTTRNYGGTGLGLAICKRLSEMMGGAIGVKSQLGQGSTFWFTMKLEVAEKRETITETIPNLDHFHVLIVEDHDICRRLMEEYLTCWDIDFQSVTDAQDAIQKLEVAFQQGNPYNLVLTDYHMPGMDGVALGEYIKRTPSLANTQLILLTGAGQRGDAKRFKEAGFSAYLVKPVSQSTLFDTIITLCDGRYASELLTKYSIKELRRQKQEDRPDTFRVTSAKSRILLVEDNIINQKVAAGILEKLGMTVDVAGNGIEAVQLSGLLTYDLILMDCQMPEMDGFEATQKIRQREGGKSHTPIIALTANALKGDQDKCLAAGMDDYLPKPINVKQLQATCAKWLQNSIGKSPVE